MTPENPRMRPNRSGWPANGMLRSAGGPCRSTTFCAFFGGNVSHPVKVRDGDILTHVNFCWRSENCFPLRRYAQGLVRRAGGLGMRSLVCLQWVMPSALVTGASRGVGRGVAVELAAQGFHVFATGRSIATAVLPPSVVRIKCDHCLASAAAPAIVTSHAESKMHASPRASGGLLGRAISSHHFYFHAHFMMFRSFCFQEI